MDLSSNLREIVKTTVVAIGSTIGITATLASAVVTLPLLVYVLINTTDPYILYKEERNPLFRPPYEGI